MVDIAELGTYVHAEVNKEYWEILLNALAWAAKQHNFEFDTQGERYSLTYVEKDALGASIVSARHLYLSPKYSESKHLAVVDLDIVDGTAASYVESILAALSKRGIYLVRRDIVETFQNEGGLETENDRSFPHVVIGRAILNINGIWEANTAEEVDRCFGIALGYLTALAELGLISADVKIDLTQEAEHVFNGRHEFLRGRLES